MQHANEHYRNHEPPFVIAPIVSVRLIVRSMRLQQHFLGRQQHFLPKWQRICRATRIFFMPGLYKMLRKNMPKPRLLWLLLKIDLCLWLPISQLAGHPTSMAWEKRSEERRVGKVRRD